MPSPLGSPRLNVVINRIANGDDERFFIDKEVMEEYRDYQKTYYDIRVLFLLVTLTVIFYINRCHVHDPFNDGFYFAFSFTCTILSTLLYLLFISAYLLKYYVVGDKSILYKISAFLLRSRSMKDFIDDAISIGWTLGISTCLYARVRKGQCSDDVTIWESQMCNPVANSYSIPIDHVVFVLLLPLVFQTIINGMTFRATLISWGVTSSFVGISMNHVNGKLESWLMLSTVTVVVISYKYERLMRLTFAQNKKNVVAEKEIQKNTIRQQYAEHQLLLEKTKHELEIYTMKTESEYKLMEREKTQMVALIGNIAHDLKTPLQSFLVDLESLQIHEDFAGLMATLPDNADGPKAILASLESTCYFMSMAINRSLDYVKASRDVALVPRMETFNLKDVLMLAVEVIRSLKLTLQIVVNPLPTTLCSNIITDKLWFTENVLCLLSNAVKYGGGDEVTVTVAHISNSELKEAMKKDGIKDDMKGMKEGLKEGERHSEKEGEREGGREGESGERTTRVSTNNSSLTSSEKSRTITLDTRERRLSTYGSAQLIVDPHFTDSTSSIMVSIEDAGVGISEKTKKELFLPFKQVQRLAGGTGLGLYSLSNRIRALHGYRGMRERKDGEHGSEFWFSIPYCPDENLRPEKEGSPISLYSAFSSQILPTASNPSSPVTPPPNPCKKLKLVKKLRFLVVDDSCSICRVLCRGLQNINYHVESAENGQEALEKLKNGYESRHYDVVLMDLQMPIMDGIQAVKLYREFETKKLAELSESSENSERSENVGRKGEKEGVGKAEKGEKMGVKRGAESDMYDENCGVGDTGGEGREEVSAKAKVTERGDSQKVQDWERNGHTEGGSEGESGRGLDIDEGEEGEEGEEGGGKGEEEEEGVQEGEEEGEGEGKAASRRMIIIGMSACSDGMTVQCALEAGMDSFFSKPFAVAVLQPLLTRLQRNNNIGRNATEGNEQGTLQIVKGNPTNN